MEGKNLILLIKALLNGKSYTLDSIDFKKIYALAKFHSLQNILYYAINKYIKDFGSNEIDSSILKQLQKDNMIELAKSATQEAELEILKKELNNKQIKFMPLKGSVLRYLYPSIDMRSMADLDIYFEGSKHKEVKNIMLELGYNVYMYGKSNHDVYRKEPLMDVEMHRELMHDSFAFHKYYKNYFEKLDKVNEFEYAFSKEDYYIYMICHSAKHMMISGTGFRNVIDEYIYLRKYENELDFEYINKELEKLEITKYEENMRNLSQYLFSDKENSFDSEYIDFLNKMTDYIFGSGTYGTLSNHVMNNFLGDRTKDNLSSSKIKYMFRRVFPNYEFMCNRYPKLRKCPILLPYYYIARIICAMFNKHLTSELKTTKKIEKEKLEEYKDIKNKIGA